MALPASTTSLAFVLYEVQSTALAMKSFAQNASAYCAANSVDSQWVFNFLDRFYAQGVALNAWSLTPGLDAYAKEAISKTPPYTANITADITTTINAGLQVINWVVTNFPKDSTGEYILAYKLNADGSRTVTSFMPNDTAGLRSALAAFIATIA